MKVVIINCFDTYESRVELLHEYFVNRGDGVQVFTADFCHFKKCKRTDAPKDFVLIETKPYEKNLSLRRILSHMDFAKKVRKAIETQGAAIDLLWVMLPPNSMAKQMAAVKKRYPRLWVVYDIIDVWPESMPFGGVEKLPPLRYWKGLRDKYLTCADAVVTECKLFQEKMAGKVPQDKFSNLYFAKQDAAEFVDNAVNEKMELAYMGSINHIVDIEVIGKVIRQLGTLKKVTLHVVGDGERREDLLKEAREAGAEVVYYGTVYDKDAKMQILSKCHFGLNIMKDSVCVGLTMKSMDYFAAGLPMVNNIHGDTWNIIEEKGFGVNYPFETEAALELCQSGNVRQQVREYFDRHFSKEAFMIGVDEIVEKVICVSE